MRPGPITGQMSWPGPRCLAPGKPRSQHVSAGHHVMISDVLLCRAKKVMFCGAERRMGHLRSAGEEMKPHPGPGDEHADPAGPGVHGPREYLPQRRNGGAGPGGEQLQDDPAQQDRQVAENRDVVTVHRSTRNQPRPSQPARTIERPAQVLSTGSVSVLIVGWA